MSRSDARRTPQWARSGGAAGIPERIRPRGGLSRNDPGGGRRAGGPRSARALGGARHDVSISPRRGATPGGRVALERRLPGLAGWGRVRDWRLLQINKLPNVELYLESEMTTETSGRIWR